MTGVIIKVVTGKNFGFIKGQDGKEYFFHKQDFNGFFDDLATDAEKAGTRIPVEFEIAQSLAGKGPRAREVTRMDDGIIPSS